VQFSADILTQCWFLCGPTACGKSALSLSLAERLDAEIVSLDSMSLYRGMDIGTAKPSLAERSRVPHHLIDVLEPHEEYSLAQYLTAAESACRQIVARGHRPLFVGGTGLYLKGVLRGVFEGPAADWTLRRELDEQLQRDGHVALHRELQAIDPESAARLHPNDARRVIRAIEVFRLTGQPLSELHTQGPRPPGERTPHVYWLSPPREWLYQRINDRVAQMFAQGLLDEVRTLMLSPRALSQTARQALGYKEVIDWFEAANDLSGSSQSSEVESTAGLMDLIQTRTRQFAKRQHTWFRNLEECIPIPILGQESAVELADQIAIRAELP
jgi:tRNA dimethylallyltransferase